MKPSRKNDRKMLAALSDSCPRAASQRVSATILRSRFKIGSPVLTILMATKALLRISDPDLHISLRSWQAMKQNSKDTPVRSGEEERKRLATAKELQVKLKEYRKLV
jgi:hypothetical protein